MNHPEHPAKTQSHRTGIFATLSHLLSARGSGAPSSSLAQGIAAPSHRRAPLALASLLALGATASPALAVDNPVPA